MSVSLGPFMTCFVTILILTGYVHFIMKRNSALFWGTIKIVFGVIAVILLRMMVPINFPFTKTIYSSKLLIGLGNIVYAMYMETERFWYQTFFCGCGSV